MDENPTTSTTQTINPIQEVELTKNQKIVGPIVLIGAILVGLGVIFLNNQRIEKVNVTKSVNTFLIANTQEQDLSSLVTAEFIKNQSIKDHTKLAGPQLEGLSSVRINKVKPTVNNIYRADGVANYSDGESAPMYAILEKTGNDWKIVTVEINVSSERIEKFYKSQNPSSNS